MKSDNFILFIIFIVTLIMISLLKECNKDRLKELENKETKEIVETFFHLDSADPTEPGQKGYLITQITEGKYGGRSKQEILDNIGHHNEGDYITESEKEQYGSDLSEQYGSDLFNIIGTEKNPVDCNLGNAQFPYDCDDDTINGKLAYIYPHIQLNKYGGNTCNDIIIDSDNTVYKYVKNDDSYTCPIQVNNKVLLKIIIVKNGPSIKIDSIIEPNWVGFLNSSELSEILFDNVRLTDLSYDDIYRLIENQNNNNLLTSYYYKKFHKNNKYYDIDLTDLVYTFTDCGKKGSTGPDNDIAEYCANKNGVWSINAGTLFWQIPIKGRWKISIFGANGNTSKGYYISSTFDLNKYNNGYYYLRLQVGQQGEDINDGAGGSFVYYNSTLLLAAGGGGGDAIAINVYDPEQTESVAERGGNAGFEKGEKGYGCSGGEGGGNREGEDYGGAAPEEELEYKTSAHSYTKIKGGAGGGGGTNKIFNNGMGQSSGGKAQGGFFGSYGYGGGGGGFGKGGGGEWDYKSYYNSNSKSGWTIVRSGGGGGGGYGGGNGGGGTYIKHSNGAILETGSTINYNGNIDYSCYSGGGGGSSYISNLKVEILSSRIRNDGDGPGPGGKIILEYLGVY